MAVSRFTHFARTETGLLGENEGVGLGGDHRAFLSARFTRCGRECPPGTGTSHLPPPSDGHGRDSWIGYRCRQRSGSATWQPVPAGQGIPFPAVKPTATKIFQMHRRQKKVFQDPGIRATDPEIPGLAKRQRLYSPVPADTSAPGSLAQQKG